MCDSYPSCIHTLLQQIQYVYSDKDSAWLQSQEMRWTNKRQNSERGKNEVGKVAVSRPYARTSRSGVQSHIQA